MKRKILAVLLCIALLFSGCSYGQTGIDGLLQPPKLSDQQNKIYTALQNGVGTNIRLKYPRTGDFTSAFLIADIDDESTQEAFVFYENLNAVNATMTLRINVLDQVNGEWVSVYEAGVAAVEVNKINFIQSNGNTFVVIGFELSGGEKMFVVYNYRDGRLVETARMTCQEYMTANLNDDNFGEIFAVTSDVNSGNKSVQAFQISSQGSVRPMGRADMDPMTSAYRAITVGSLEDGRQALFLDGIGGSDRYTTEVLVYDEGNVQNLIYSAEPEKNQVEQTLRHNAVYCRDVDGDGVTEIPTRLVAEGYEQTEMHETEYFTLWLDCGKDGSLRTKTLTYVASTLGFLFRIPDKWLGKVTPVFSSADSELTFYRYDGEDTEATVKLLSIRMFRSNAFREGVSDYTTLRENGQIVYAKKVYNEDPSLTLDDEMIQACFGLYTQ